MEVLLRLYNQTSKHSNYQILSERLRSIVDIDKLRIKTRYEAERLSYIKKKISFEHKYFLDVGGNTGYFSFELLDLGAEKVHFIEGNAIHSKFVSKSAEIIGVHDRIEISNQYLTFKDELDDRNYDVILLLNVLHHLGDDYGNKKISIEKAKDNIPAQINSLAGKTSEMVLQLGFNWKGNITTPLFKNGTKSEMIEFIKNGTKEYWEIIAIGIPELSNGEIIYSDLNSKNIVRDNSLGEFLNRPIFILKSKYHLG